MTLETAKNNVKKALKSMKFAKSMSLPYSNHVLIAYNKAKPKLSSMQSAMKFDEWFAKFQEENKETLIP